ncbi:hypothetical protein TNCV_3029331 [Trichonephila clavipes]|nr:hypothetical protein TNCV_3029331 [Trichonephila clavipes]
MDEKADAGDQLIVEVVQRSKSWRRLHVEKWTKPDARDQEAEKNAETARGEMGEKPEAGERLSRRSKTPKRMHKLKVEKWTRRPGTKRPKRMRRLHVEKWTRSLTLGTSRLSRWSKRPKKKVKRILGEPDEEVGGAMKKPDDVSVAFGGARPKIKPRNTFDDGGGVMEKTKSKRNGSAKTASMRGSVQIKK